MTANIWRDSEIVCCRINVSLTDSRELSVTRQWEGTFCTGGGEKFDVRERYRLELDEGKSADILLTYVLGRKPAIVHFRVLAWKVRAQAIQLRANES